MCAFFVGRPLEGNFKASIPVGNIQKCYVERRSQHLYLKDSTSAPGIELIPMGNEAYQVISKFNDGIGSDCKSIYKLVQYGDTIVVILYLYDDIFDLTLESQKIVIHLRRSDENQMLSSEGMAGIHVDSTEEIPSKLKERFVSNRSIFVQPGKKGSGILTLLGDDCWATIIMERPGVYVIDSLHKKGKKDVSYGVQQIFGQIEFMLSSDALAERGNEATELHVGYSEIFEAWDQYMDFQMNKLSRQRASQIYGFTEVFVMKSGKVKVWLNREVNLNSIKDIEFEYMPGHQFDYNPDHIPDGKQLDLLTSDRRKRKCYLGLITNQDRGNSKELIFDMPRFGLLDSPGGGVIYLSDRSLEIEQRRRRKTKAYIDSGKSETLNTILGLSNPNVKDIQVSGTKNPDNRQVLKQMFGTDKIELTPNYRNAMRIALNTPDIALIQGPPGTGKTTLIKGILARLKQDNEDIKVLISSEQHDAMYNMIDRFTDTGIMPPYVSSKRFGEEEESEVSFEEIVSKYQRTCLEVCDRILEREGKVERTSSHLKKLTALLVQIRGCDYSRHSIQNYYAEIEELVTKIGCADKVVEDLTKLGKYVGDNASDSTISDPRTKLLMKKLSSQRLDLDSFLGDDGLMNFESLQSTLRTQGFEKELFPVETSNILRTEDREKVSQIFDDYRMYVAQLKNHFAQTKPSVFDMFDAKTCIEHINDVVSKFVNRDVYTIEGIVERFHYLLEDEEIISAVVRKYTTVVGSTCAQAGRLQSGNGPEPFDYVIVDEAARANPLDLMIPLALGKKVLLVGDHKQLPHYIESQDVNEFAVEDADNKVTRKEILTKSLFQIIYENLEKAKKEGRINAERVAMIKEQHRMHPDICQFISETFYDDELGSSEQTKTHLNTYGICNDKNIGYIDVPFNKGADEFIDNTYRRPAEAKKIIEIVNEILSKNPDGQFSMGIIAYYRGQVDLIQKMIDEAFTEEDCDRISCGTVDSYQGKEFDIVILSGVRCNPRHQIGFIKSEPSRINVSLSRARNLMLMVCDVDTYRGSGSGSFDIFARYFDYCDRVGYHEKSI